MAVGPFGPWLTSRNDADDEAPEPPGLGLNIGPRELELGPPETGTAIDEFLPLYWVLARPTRTRPAMGPAEIDALDLSVMAALLGLRPDDPDDEFGPLTGDFDADSARVIAARVAEAHETDT